jgi:hypothetical protein
METLRGTEMVLVNTIGPYGTKNIPGNGFRRRDWLLSEKGNTMTITVSSLDLRADALFSQHQLAFCSGCSLPLQRNPRYRADL